jgi:ADP-ribosyl-[dinitrogen reductase] hydrolase
VIDQAERYRGCLLGLATGNALGSTPVFSPPGDGTAPLVEEMVGGGPFDIAREVWTDDTSMVFCLAKSLTEKQGFDPVDLFERYLRWSRHSAQQESTQCLRCGRTGLGSNRIQPR